MKDAVIVDAIRTPIGRYAGSLKDIRPDDLAALVIKELVKRNNLEADLIEDVLLGCANQAGEDNRNVARMAVLLAGLPVSVGGGTVNRLCGSGLMAVNDAARAIQTNSGDIYLAGGVESMTRSPFVMGKPESAFPRGEMRMFDTTLGWRFTNEKLAQAYHPFSMGETAENVAEKYKISREAQDEFALQSQHKYQAAKDKISEEIVAVQIPGKKPKAPAETFAQDEHPRADAKIEDLIKLKAAFREGGTVTAGNSSGINDGASCLLLASSEAAQKLGMKPRARIVSSAVAGCDPAIMGIGPVEATRKALKRASLSIKDIDLFELNEAFAVQVLACVKDLEVPMDKLNVNGGSIALGHPLGASGARILTTLLYEMERRKSRYGLATMCIGVGQGIATIIERLD
ncbi:MAG: thiolase family protein [Candidatus Melainabacteria bacterium]|nr:MAG: thiolase family protein [Candidatus Melainabacteria bacterium]